MFQWPNISTYVRTEFYESRVLFVCPVTSDRNIQDRTAAVLSGKVLRQPIVDLFEHLCPWSCIRISLPERFFRFKREIILVLRCDSTSKMFS